MKTHIIEKYELEINMLKTCLKDITKSTKKMMDS